MYLKNLNALYIDMQKNGADSVVFAAQVEGHPFSFVRNDLGREPFYH